MSVNMWMVRAGEGSFLIDEFIKNNVVAIGWNMGDLTEKSDEEIKELFKNKYHNLRSLNEVLKFKNDINIGDYVLSANGETKTYFIGKITSDYKRSMVISRKDSSGDNYFDVRDVEWLGEVQRNQLNKYAQKKVGLNFTVFNIDVNSKENVLNVYKDNNEAIEKSSSIIRNYIRENNLEEIFNGDLDEIFIKFKEEFGPEVLEKLEGIDLLNKIFLHDSDKSTLCYNLEFNDEFNRGGIGGGSAFKYSLFKSNKNNQWTSGSTINPRILTEQEAIDIGTKIRDALVNSVKYIENTNLNSITLI